MLFLIIMFIIGIRLFGWSVRVMGRILGGLLGIMLVMMIFGGFIGLVFRFFPIILTWVAVYYLVRRRC